MYPCWERDQGPVTNAGEVVVPAPCATTDIEQSKDTKSGERRNVFIIKWYT